MRKDEKRNARRIPFDTPVDASLSHIAVQLLDLSTSGARLRHHDPVPFVPGKRYVLEFQCDGERFELKCQVVRSRMEQSSNRLTYISGVRFVELEETVVEQLWGLMAMMAIDILEHEGLAEDLSFDFEIRSH